uniref:RNA-directed RNA polymerase n=1 Tax=Conidiobolus chlamydosporus totivirus 3 TaxID=2980977 RepID=A0A977R5H9_9VIRU|nr:RNA-dependent RNA polymerase [Conidiobolus chlamydosporus totivirus 3]
MASGLHSFSERIAERVSVFKCAGLYLEQFIDEGLVANISACRSVGDEYLEVSRIRRETGVLSACAASLLLCSVPVQVELSTAEICNFFSECIEKHGAVPKPGRNMLPQLLNRDFRIKTFPLKAHQGATNKVNVYLSEVLDALRQYNSTHLSRVGVYVEGARGLYDDQASAWVMWSAYATRYLPNTAVQYGLWALKNPKEVKGIGVALKSLGAAADPAGCMFVEMDTMQGRASDEGDLDSDCAARVVHPYTQGVVCDDDERFRRIVRNIILAEIKDRPRFKSMDEFWDTRWSWCVNGSHSRLLERAYPALGVDKLPGVTQVHRRVFAESLTDNPLPSWRGDTFVSMSPKLEHGKVRALYACDTLNYFGFEHLLRPVEKVWANRRVVLDPGANGHIGMIERVRKLRSQAYCSVMMDYDDFNSQHTLHSQQVVIDELVKVTGYDPEMGARLVKSFESMTIYHRGQLKGVATGSLMSGHRGTTFINSILNAAYIQYFVGDNLWAGMKSVHVGDDVYMSVPDSAQLDGVVSAMLASPCRMNTAKQSIGVVASEFLRVATSGSGSYGYLARSIASTVSGNWVNELKLSPMEGLQTIVNHARTLINRSGDTDAWMLLVPCAWRMTGLGKTVLREILSGRAGFNGGPVWGKSTQRRDYTIMTSRRSDAMLPMGVSGNATSDYLSKAATDIERYALESVGVSVKSAMLRSSYTKSLAGAGVDMLRLVVSGTRMKRVYGNVHVSELLKTSLKEGVLAQFPLLHLLKSALTQRETRELVGLAGGDMSAPDIFAEAWGETTTGKVVDGWLSYADAGLLSGRTYCGVMYTSHPMYV